MDSVKGAQTVSRASLLLRLVSASAPEGMTTAAAIVESGFTRPTAHRLLAALAAEGLVDQDARTGRWHPGPELFLMGLVAASRYDISDLARETLRAVATRTGESAFLSARRGDESVCLMAEEGSFPLRSFVLHEGIRFPLGVASAGLVMLAFLPEVQVDSYFRRRVDLVETFGAEHSEKRIRERMAQTRAAGYAVNPGLVVEGSYGMGAAVFDRHGEPAWALSITGVESRFPAARQRELGALLLAHAHELGTRLQSDRRRP